MPACAEASELSAVPPLGGGGIERGIAFLRCATATKGIFQTSRGAILDVGATDDVLLATAHGLPPDAEAVKRDCRVLVRGKAHAIAEVWHAGGDRAGPKHDWAVIVTQRITGDVHRWRVGLATSDWLINAASQGAPISLVLRSPDVPQNDCRLEPETQDPRVLFAHSCVTYPGMSGSPMVVGLAVEPEPVLIAVHIGSQSSLDRHEARFRERRAAHRCGDRRHDRGGRRAPVEAPSRQPPRVALSRSRP